MKNKRNEFTGCAAPIGSVVGLVGDPVHGAFPIGVLERELVGTIAFKRLLGVGQTLARLVVPTAVHSRHEHSLGVYYLALQAVKHLKKEGGLRIEESVMGAFLISALLHDLGHGPFSHTLEGVLPSHETVGRWFIENGEIAEILQNYGVSPAQVADFIDPNRVSGVNRILSRILSAPIDVDKLDYIKRDLFYSGRHVPSLVLSTILGALTVHRDELVLRSEGVGYVLHMLALRDELYGIYWHPVVRAYESMLTRAVQDALLRSALTPELIRCQDDKGLLDLLMDPERLSVRSVRELVSAFVVRNQYKEILSLEPTQAFYSRARDPERRRLLEVQLAGQLSIEDHEILFVPPKRMGRDEPIRVLLPERTLLSWEEATGEDPRAPRWPEIQQRAYVICAPDRYCDLIGKRQEIYDALMRALS